ncbi:hypothetical protein BGZ94_009450 [Podila epigama]|nr:hypothetical protein BGZ94_009450 [Podila epigama]
MSRAQGSQQGSSLLGTQARSGGTSMPLTHQSLGASSGANMLSTSIKSNASSSTSAPRVTSSFGHRHDSSGRRASSESLPPGRNRGSIVGTSFTPDDDDVNAFVKMMDSQEPLKMFGKNSGSGLGPSFGQGESSHMSASAINSKAALDRFQQLKQVNASLSDSMTASQVISKETKDQSPPFNLGALTISTGTPRKSSISEGEATSPISLPFATGPLPVAPRHSSSLSHQPGIPSPLHSEIPVYPPTKEASRASDRTDSPHSNANTHASQSRHVSSASDGMTKRRSSWLVGSGIHDIPRRGSNFSSSSTTSSNLGHIAFRHGSLDQGKDILGLENAMGKVNVTGSDEMAFGSFPEDVHHQHSLYSAPLETRRRGDDDGGEEEDLASGSHGVQVNPRPIPPSSLATSGSASSRAGRMLRLGSRSSVTRLTLPRLGTRGTEENESLNEMSTVDDGSRHDENRRQRHNAIDDEEEESGRRGFYGREEQDEEQGLDQERDKNNQSLNDDDEMLFIMSELSPGSNSEVDTAMQTGNMNMMDRGNTMLPLTGALLGMRSQTQSPSMGPHGPLQATGAPGSSRSDASHLRLFGRVSNAGSHNGSVASGTGYNTGATSASHSRGGSSHSNGTGAGIGIGIGNGNGTGNNQGSHPAYRRASGAFSHGNSTNNSSTESLGHGHAVLPMMRRSGSVEDYLMPLRSNSTPPVMPHLGGVNAHTGTGGGMPGTLPPSLSSSSSSLAAYLPGGGVVNMNTPLPVSSSTTTTATIATTTTSAFDAMLDGRRMSRGGSDRGVNIGGSGASTGGHNSFHSEGRGKIEGW